jgi:hypothetical protein
MWLVRKALKSAAIGAAVGIGIAVLMVSIYYIRPFAFPVDGMVERLTFKLCPFFILGFALKSSTVLVVVTILGNALLYGVLFSVIVIGLELVRRMNFQRRTE